MPSMNAYQSLSITLQDGSVSLTSRRYETCQEMGVSWSIQQTTARAYRDRPEAVVSLSVASIVHEDGQYTSKHLPKVCHPDWIYPLARGQSEQ